MNRKELQTYNVLLRQVSSERAERDTSALARSSLFQYEKRDRERIERRNYRLLVIVVWGLTALVCCVTLASTF